MKNYNSNVRIGFMVSLFLVVWVIFATPILYTRLLYLFNKTNKDPIKNSNMARSICSRHHKILYGIFSMPQKFETRAVLRKQTQCDFNNEINQVVFVLGMPQTDSDYEIVIRESRIYHDIFVLSCEENMNDGKTYTYFKEALEQLPCFDFYAKVDDDTAFTPGRLYNKIAEIPNNTSLYIGRSPRNYDTEFFKYIAKMIRFPFHDMSWIYQVDYYNAGMIYILNLQAVKSWVALNPVDMYGDEDYRTAYYMTIVGAKFIDVGEMFHDYIKYKTTTFMDHWRLNITKNSLAVHQCKDKINLYDAFKQICAI
jgi:hypothetical protein